MGLCEVLCKRKRYNKIPPMVTNQPNSMAYPPQNIEDTFQLCDWPPLSVHPIDDECWRKRQFCACKFKQFFPKIISKEHIRITHNWFGHSMQSNYVGKENLCNSDCCIKMCKGIKFAYFEKRFTTTNKIALPLTLGNLSIKSVKMSDQIWVGSSRGCSNPFGCKLDVYFSSKQIRNQ